MYLSWALYAEGNSDRDYFEALLPRVLEELILTDGKFSVDIPTNYAVQLGKYGRTVEEVAAEACAAKNAFELLFIHADTGGRALEDGIENRAQAYVNKMNHICEFRADRAVIIAPKHETEAWLLADRNALLATLGYRDTANALGLPDDADKAEKLIDPKAALRSAIDAVYGNRITAKRDVSFGSIALQQDLQSLRGSASYRKFEADLRASLSTWGIL
ncbi:hypothetical protein [Rhizobium sp. RCC_161_2]|uniref:hypothetical protein n=1 Tax=Rhizobium sp. RCC_161_2 TaxID=3239219 RepID=UPI003523EC3B